MPTVYQDYAVDFRGDGRRDIWSDDPTDALASTANYLVRYNWRRGEAWGMEVHLPQGFDTSATGRRNRRSVADWRAAGVRRASGGPVPDHGAAAIHAPAGPRGPAWILYRNFDAILRYNPSTNYGIGIGHMADRLAGGRAALARVRAGRDRADAGPAAGPAAAPQRCRVRHRHARRRVRAKDRSRHPRLPAGARGCP